MPPASRLLLLATALGATPALADGGIRLAVAGGTIGVGPVAGVRLSPQFGAHGDAALLAVSRHLQSGMVGDFDHLKLRTAAAMIDLFPFASGVRLSAGARYEGEQAPVAPAAIPLGRSRLQRGWTSIGPALTLGWTHRFGHGLVAVLEGGTMLRRDARLAADRPLRASPIAQIQMGWRF